MTEHIIIAGSGGQGIMLLGKVLAEAAARENKYITWLPAYGAEVRGGSAYCMVVISDEEIASPCIEKADSLIVMNGISLEKFKTRLKKNGLLIINDSFVNHGEKNNPRVIKEPFSDIAGNLGNIKTANMLALGVFVAKTKIVNIKNVLSVIEDIAPVESKGLIEINKKALCYGFDLVK